MKTVTCDVCGAKAEREIKVNGNETFIDYPVVLRVCTQEGLNVSPFEEIDLCPHCKRIFEKWIARSRERGLR